MDMSFNLAAIMAFAPALVIMYLVLRKYTFPRVEQPFFSDPALFGLFAVGLVIGTILAVVNYIIVDYTNIIYAILSAILQCLAMVIVLNLKRFHGKSDTVFLGYGLGIGIGCSMALGVIYLVGSSYSELDNIGAEGYIWIFILGLSFILLMSAVGTTVGEGIARLRPMEFALQGILITVAFGMLLVAVYSQAELLWMYIYTGFAFMLSLAYFYYIMYYKLSGVVRDVLRMEGNKREVP